MTPTQAQIEAAAKEIRIMLATIGNPTPENLAYAALTAAAEVGDKMGPWDARYSGSAKEIEDHTIERCGQVAKEKAEQQGIIGPAMALMGEKFGLQNAIEYEWFSKGWKRASEAIFAAIRALKEDK